LNKKIDPSSLTIGIKMSEPCDPLGVPCATPCDRMTPY